MTISGKATYFEGIISSEWWLVDEVAARIRNTRVAFTNMRPLWHRWGIRLSLKDRIDNCDCRSVGPAVCIGNMAVRRNACGSHSRNQPHSNSCTTNGIDQGWSINNGIGPQYSCNERYQFHDLSAPQYDRTAREVTTIEEHTEFRSDIGSIDQIISLSYCNGSASLVYASNQASRRRHQRLIRLCRWKCIPVQMNCAIILKPLYRHAYSLVSCQTDPKLQTACTMDVGYSQF